jgi:hypothetical protein
MLSYFFHLREDIFAGLHGHHCSIASSSVSFHHIYCFLAAFLVQTCLAPSFLADHPEFTATLIKVLLSA